MPITAICDLEQHKLPRSERIHHLKWGSQNDRMRRGNSLTDNVKVATNAHTKLLHIVLMRNIWLISCWKHGVEIRKCCIMRLSTSIENRTPPIGDPKATATPAALAAVIISRIFPRLSRIENIYNAKVVTQTLASRKPLEPTCDDRSNAACDMNRRAFLTDGQPRSDHQRLFLVDNIVCESGKTTY